jgi:hypothetical protein
MAEKKSDSPGPRQGQGGGQATAGITKMEGVKRALKALGKDAKPLAIQAYLKDKLGIEISADVASNYKKVLAKRARAKGTTPAQKPAAPKAAAQKAEPHKESPKPQLQPSPAPPAKQGDGKANAIPLTDILYVKELVGRHGTSPLHTLIDAFAR